MKLISVDIDQFIMVTTLAYDGYSLGIKIINRIASQYYIIYTPRETLNMSQLITINFSPFGGRGLCKNHSDLNWINLVNLKTTYNLDIPFQCKDYTTGNIVIRRNITI